MIAFFLVPVSFILGHYTYIEMAFNAWFNVNVTAKLIFFYNKHN